MIIDTIYNIGRSQYAAGASLGPRKTLDYEFVRILKGQVTWIYDGVEYKTKAGDWILSQPGCTEHYLWDTQGATKHDHIHFTLTDLPTSLPKPEYWPTVGVLGTDNIMQVLFEQIIQLDKSNHSQCIKLMKMTVQQMLYFWVYQVYDLEAQEFDMFSQPVQRVIDAMQSQWCQGNIKPLSVTEMTQIACVSRSCFLKTFKEECNDTPSHFFEKSRLFLGRLHLTNSNRTINQISELLCYSSPFHFSKNFKQFFGCAPRDFKDKRQQEQSDNNDYLFKKVFNILSATQTL